MPPDPDKGSRGDHRSARCEKAEIPEQPITASDRFVDVVQPQNLMVDDQLDKIEAPKADKHQSRELRRRPAEVTKPARPPKNE